MTLLLYNKYAVTDESTPPDIPTTTCITALPAASIDWATHSNGFRFLRQGFQAGGIGI